MRVPRRLKDLQGSIREAVATLSPILARAPKPSEIAARLNVPFDEVVEALNAGHAYTARSLDALVAGTDVALGDLRAGQRVVGHGGVPRFAASLAGRLPQRDRAILILRFFGDLTQTQIAEEVGISQMHVSRLLTQTLATLRARLEAD